MPASHPYKSCVITSSPVALTSNVIGCGVLLGTCILARNHNCQLSYTLLIGFK